MSLMAHQLVPGHSVQRWGLLPLADQVQKPREALKTWEPLGLQAAR